MTDFKRAHEFVARWEGGKVDDPVDRGGRTAYGVTQGVYNGWRTRQGLPVRDVWAITQDEVLSIYEGQYWPAASGLPWPLSGVAYDIAVNHGPGNLRLMLATAGDVGTPAERASRLIDAREAFFHAIVRGNPSQKRFLRGWLNRVNAQRAWLKENAAPSTPPAVILIDGGGKEVPWNGKPTVYGGVSLTADLVAQLRTVYPTAGGPWEYAPLRVWVRRNGDMVLEK